MIKSYKLKIYPNKEKAKKLNELLAWWQDVVNHFIKIFWCFDKLDGSYPPKEYTKGGRLVRDAAVKAWQIVKTAKKTKQKKKPFFKSKEIDLNEFSGKIIEDFKTKEFDLWLSVISLDSKQGRGNSHRLKLPCKKHREFNKTLEKGELRKSMKISKEGKHYFVTLFVKKPEVNKENNQVVGLDVGLNKAVTASDGKVFGEDLKDLRIRTKWRSYKRGLSAFKQGLNRVAKEIMATYPNSDFAVEKLHFKGKRKRSRSFRRRNNNWAYAHLSRRLEELEKVKGFRLFKVSPAYSSQCCPVCGFTSKANRLSDEVFSCGQCGYREDADCVGAWNLAERVAKDYPCLRLITPKDVSLHLSTNVGGG